MFACLIASSLSARLENTYLPPPGAGSSGGGPGLVAPGGGSKQTERPIAILSQTNENNGDGSYKYRWVFYFSCANVRFGFCVRKFCVNCQDKK